MNLTLLLSLAFAWAVSVAAAGFYGLGVGRDLEEAAAAREERLILTVNEKTLQATAEAIANIEVKHVTVTQKLQKEVFSRETFRECVSGPEPVRLFNSTIESGSGEAKAIADPILPAKDSAGK